MFARMATFSLADPTMARDVLREVREAVMPIVESLEGWRGATQLFDEEGRKMVVIQLFDSRENLDAAESTFDTMPQRMPDDLRDRMGQITGGLQSVDRFEVLGEMRV